MANQLATLDLHSWPLIYVSSTHFETEALNGLEDDLARCGARLTYDVQEAEIVLSKVVQKKRAQFDLRERGLITEEIKREEKIETEVAVIASPTTPKKRKHEGSDFLNSGVAKAIVIDDSSTESGEELDARARSTNRSSISIHHTRRGNRQDEESHSSHQDLGKVITVAKVEWFTDSQRLGRALKLDGYVIYEGKRIKHAATARTVPRKPAVIPETVVLTTPSINTTQPVPSKSPTARDILQRAKEDAPTFAPKPYDRFGKRRFGKNVPSARPSSWESGHGGATQYAHLLKENTTEHEDGSSSDVPEPPEWVKKGFKYACQRLTPKNNPNDAFIELLKEIKLARLLTNDEIGVRAYSTSIASLAAYTYKINSPREILALPGCDRKIANLFVDWTNTGTIQAVRDIEKDEDLKILKTFYNIWGVGSTIAREFFYKKGWQDLDDVVEYGWTELSRVQQIGVKYYDEFLDLIPRVEVEQIGEVIRQHAVRVRDSGIQTMLVGGYRRGKEASGDVDIIVTHPDEGSTLNLVEDIVNSLEEDEWITHTLILSLKSTERNQETLPYRTGGGGHGFDTLDKAMVVWQNPLWPSKNHDLSENAKAKNPNIHRRVDIIVSPWRTIGCAVVGWSGGTTFERDIRRYAKNVKTWKFDSSGVRDRQNGQVIDIEGYYEWKGEKAPECRAKTMEEAERRVFEGFGLTYRQPWERCTG